MKESCSEGEANHAGPESCGTVREVRVEALTGGNAGWVLSREILISSLGCRRRGGLRKATLGRPPRPGLPGPYAV